MEVPRKKQSAWHVGRRPEQPVQGGGSEVRAAVRIDLEQGFSVEALLTFWAGFVWGLVWGLLYAL